MLSIPSAALFAQQSPQPQFRNHGAPTTAPATPVAAPSAQPKFQNQRPPPILDEAAPDGGGGGFTGTQGLTNVPEGAFQVDRTGVRQAALFRNTQFPYGPLLQSQEVGPSVRTGSVTADFKLTLPGLTGGLPFTQRGFEPQDADLKVGPFFFKLRAVEAAFLYSDNINLSPDHRESGEIAFTGVTIDIIAQITEDLRITTSGTLVYLPIQGEAGIAGFGLGDFYEFGLAAGPLVHAQVEWDTKIAGWDVVFRDDFQVLEGLYSNDLRSNDVLFKGGDFNDQAVAGRYILRPQEGAIFQNHGPTDNQLGRNDLLIYSNTISAQAERLLPGPILLRALLYHEDLWYNQGNRGLPAVREGATLSLISQKENQRFKPYLEYDAFRTDELGGIQSIFRLGITGPVTDQISLLAEVGYFFGGNEGNGELWRLQLDHTISPYSQQSLIFSRNFNYFHDEIDDQIGYNFRQIIGPKLSSDLYIYHLQSQDFFTDNTQQTLDQLRAGLRFTFTPGPKTSIRLTGEYTSIDQFHTDAWTGRLEVGYNFTNTLLLYFVYQYQKSTSLQFSQNYSENLFFLSLTKYFE